MQQTISAITTATRSNPTTIVNSQTYPVTIKPKKFQTKKLIANKTAHPKQIHKKWNKVWIQNQCWRKVIAQRSSSPKNVIENTAATALIIGLSGTV